MVAQTTSTDAVGAGLEVIQTEKSPAHPRRDSTSDTQIPDNLDGRDAEACTCAIVCLTLLAPCCAYICSNAAISFSMSHSTHTKYGLTRRKLFKIAAQQVRSIYNLTEA